MIVKYLPLRKFVHILISIFMLMCFSLIFSGMAHADDKDKGLTVSPIRTELTVQPGTSQDETLTLTNSSNHHMTVHLSAEEFSVINQQYDYAFNVETQLTKWVTFTPDLLELEAGQTKTATFRVGVPLSAEPGGRYLSMFASTDVSNPEGDITSQQRIASLLYLTVDGSVSRSGHLISLNVPWITTGNTTWSASLQNTGSTHYYSRYNVVVKSLFGDDVAYSTGSSLILPGTVRLISDDQPLPNMPGIYKVTYTIGLGDTPAEVEDRYLIYVPPVFIYVSVFGMILIFSLIREYQTRKKKKA